MAQENPPLNRRSLLQGAGGITAIAALAPFLTGAAKPHCSPTTLSLGTPESVGMSSDRLEDAFARVQQRVNEGLFPGATALIARSGRVVGRRAFGTKVRGEDDPVELDTIFDLQSMTKVVATATSAMILVENGTIRLTDPVADYIPSFAANGKGDIPIRDMLRYSAGLPIDNQFLDNPDDAAVLQLMAETPLEYMPGTMVEYSDLTYRLLGKLIEAAAGTDQNTVARTHIWGPLGMKDTMYNPPSSLLPRIAATGYSELRGYLVRGEVQDEQDFALGGIAGCDGVFSTAEDLAVFCQMVLNGGCYGGTRILSGHWIAEMTKNQTPFVQEKDTDISPLYNLLFTPKGYGWELMTHRFSNGGTRLSPRSFGKIGGAGTVMWIDPNRELFGILLTNHGLPVPFDEPGWNRLVRDIGSQEFFDGMVNAVMD